MAKFHYQVIESKYGEHARLLFTDTDRLTYRITTPDLYEDLKGIWVRYEQLPPKPPLILERE